MEQIPNIILDLLMTKSFDQLSASEKKEVFQWMDEANYKRLFEANQLLNHVAFNENDLNTNAKNKAILIEKIRDKSRKKSIAFYPIALWKVAASFLLFGNVAYFYLHYNVKTDQPVYLTNTDTIYIERANFLQDTQTYFHDTVGKLFYKDDSNKAKNHATYAQANVYGNDPNSETHQLSVSDYEKKLNNKKGSSIKDDSLIQTIGFTTL